MGDYRTAPIQTLGYPSQQAAVIALYEQGHAPALISQMTGIPRNSVNRSIHKCRTKFGRVVKATKVAPREEPLAPEPRFDDWRMRNYRKAVSGARMALEAMGQ